MRAFSNILSGSTNTIMWIKQLICRVILSRIGLKLVCHQSTLLWHINLTLFLSPLLLLSSSLVVEMVKFWLRNWFPVESAFCLPQRVTDTCLKCNEKWQPSLLSFAYFTDRQTHIHRFLLPAFELATTTYFCAQFCRGPILIKQSLMIRRLWK